MIKILIIGRNELAREVIKNINKNNYICAYVKPEKIRINRGLTAFSYCKRNNIKVFNENNKNSLSKIIKNFKPKILISCGYPKIINAEILRSVDYPLNIHFGALPKYRGCHSIPMAILNNEKKIGITFHLMDEGIDSGPIIKQYFIKNEKRSSCKELYLKTVFVASKKITIIIKKIIKKQIKLKIQNEKNSSYYSMSSLKNNKINFNLDINYIRNFIRANYFPPFSSAYNYINGKKIFFLWPLKTKKKNNPNIKISKIKNYINRAHIQTANGIIIPNLIKYKKKIILFKNFIKNE
jgi:methionyl-tRNA formyltransferase